MAAHNSRRVTAAASALQSRCMRPLADSSRLISSVGLTQVTDTQEMQVLTAATKARLTAWAGATKCNSLVNTNRAQSKCSNKGKVTRTRKWPQTLRFSNTSSSHPRRCPRRIGLATSRSTPDWWTAGTWTLASSSNAKCRASGSRAQAMCQQGVTLIRLCAAANRCIPTSKLWE